MMNDEIIENMKKLNKTTYDIMKGFYEINMKVVEQGIEQQMALTNLTIECVIAQLKIIGKSKNYKDSLNEQTSLLNEASGKIQGITRNTIDIMDETKDEVTAWVEKGIEEASTIVPVSFTKKSA